MHPLFPNGLLDNDYNSLQSNIQSNLKLVTKGMKNGDRYLMNDTLEKYNTL